jgi:hypothetical protein
MALSLLAQVDHFPLIPRGDRRILAADVLVNASRFHYNKCN